MTEDVTIRLTADEALVLLDWVARCNAASAFAIVDQAEQRALWNLEAVLEKAVPHVFDPNYRQLVLQARDRLRDRNE